MGCKEVGGYFMCLFLLLELFGLPSVVMLDAAIRALEARNTGGTAVLGQIAFNLNSTSVLQGLPQGCKAAVQFTTVDGQSVNADIGLPCDSLKAARGDTIDVCYDRKNPSDLAWHDAHSKYPDPNCSDIGYAAACRLVIASLVLLSCLALSLSLWLIYALRACCKDRSAAHTGQLELGQGIQVKSLPV